MGELGVLVWVGHERRESGSYARDGNQAREKVMVRGRTSVSQEPLDGEVQACYSLQPKRSGEPGGVKGQLLR